LEELSVARLNVVDQLSINDIEKLLKRRRTRLRSLERKKGNLLKQVGSVDREISRIHGSMGRGPSLYEGSSNKGRRLPKNSKSARLYILDVLTSNKKALRPREIADAVLAAGYKSDSENFAVIVNQNLLGLKKAGLVIHDEATSTYKLAKGKAAAE
jgi:hypothetical protein